MDPGRFVSAGVHWGVSVFLLQPNLRGRFHFLGCSPFRSCIFSCMGVGLSPPLGDFGNFFVWYCVILEGKMLSVFGVDFFMGSTSAIFRVFAVLLLSGSVLENYSAIELLRSID